VKKCKKCNDTGRLSRGRYCDCKEGAFAKAKDKLEEEAKAIEKMFTQTPTVNPDKFKTKLNVNVGDWVEHGNVIGVVGALTINILNSCRLEQRAGRHTNLRAFGLTAKIKSRCRLNHSTMQPRF